MINVIEKHVPEHVPEHRQLLRDARALRLPQNPLDELIEALGGVNAVAELSGAPLPPAGQSLACQYHSMTDCLSDEHFWLAIMHPR